MAAAVGAKDQSVPFGPWAAVDSLRGVASWPYRGEVDSLFRSDLGTGRVAAIGPVEPSPAERAWIADSLMAHAAASYDADWEHASRLIETPTGPRLLAYRIYPEGAGTRPRVAYGFRSSLGTHHYMFEKVATHVPLLPPSLTNGLDTFELLSVTVSAPTAGCSTPRRRSTSRRLPPPTRWGACSQGSRRGWHCDRTPRPRW